MTFEVCSECAKGKLSCIDCCSSPFLDKDPGFWLTLVDIARIVKKTGLNPKDFCKIVDFSDDEEEEEGFIDEKFGEMVFFGDKVILMKGNGKCPFLKDGGCSIFDIRPRMCRIFPFWFKEENGDITITIEKEDFEEDECLLTKGNGGRDIPHLLKLVGETEKSMKKCIKEFIEEIKLHSKFKEQLEKKEIMKVLEDGGFVKLKNDIIL